MKRQKLLIAIPIMAVVFALIGYLVCSSITTNVLSEQYGYYTMYDVSRNCVPEKIKEITADIRGVNSKRNRAWCKSQALFFYSLYYCINYLSYLPLARVYFSTGIADVNREKILLKALIVMENEQYFFFFSVDICFCIFKC